MSNYDLKPQNFHKIASEIVNVCKKETKGKAKLYPITNVLRKFSGFQSMQTFENFIEKENKKSPYDFIKTEKDMYNELDNFSDASYPNKALVFYFKNLFGLGDEMTNFGIADCCAFECFFFNISDSTYNVFILNSDSIKDKLISDTGIDKNIVMKDEFFVYVNSMEKGDIFEGTATIYKNEYYASTKTFNNALTEAIKLIKALTNEELER